MPLRLNKTSLVPPDPGEAAGVADGLRALPAGTTFLRILGVNYVHLKTEDDGDMYLTEFGLPFRAHLRPENWYAEEWFAQNRERLAGSGTVYRVTTRPITGHVRKSIPVVVKWSRVGEDVPLDTMGVGRAISAEFNSPFEEFSLLQELRNRSYGPRRGRIMVQKPLAIYVPPERMQLWQTGRSRDRIMRKVARHAGVVIDILRSYIVIYGWIKGVDVVHAVRNSLLDLDKQRAEMARLTERCDEELKVRGFTVADHKPTHLIVRMSSGEVRQRHGDAAYALVDYELLQRTPEHEEAVRARLRSRYLFLQKDRFAPRTPAEYPPHLSPAQVLGVDFVFGHAESTNGILWVVGNDPELFSYFLPERWRSRKFPLSPSGRSFYTQTKDRVHLVWKVSRVGDLPPGDLGDPAYRPMLMQGYNSPFEEFDLALEMARRGLKVVYPRAIYVTGQPDETSGHVLDARRFDAMKRVKSPAGVSVLPMEPDYITIWGYYRGLEDDQAPDDVGYWTPIDAARACEAGLISKPTLLELVERQRERLAVAGFEDVHLGGDHMLMSYIPGGSVRVDERGEIEVRHCNIEQVRRI